MFVSDLPNLNPSVYGRANDLKQELRKMADYAQMYPTSAPELATWWGLVNTQMAALLAAADDPNHRILVTAPVAGFDITDAVAFVVSGNLQTAPAGSGAYVGKAGTVAVVLRQGANVTAATNLTASGGAGAFSGNFTLANNAAGFVTGPATLELTHGNSPVARVSVDLTMTP